MADIGHNSGDSILDQHAQGALKSFIARLEHLEDEKAGIAEHIKETIAEAKGSGFDAKTIRKVLRIRKMDRAKAQEEQALLDLYLHALGFEL